MLVKIFAPFAFTLFITGTVFAQKQNVYFLKYNGKEVSTKDSADFIRIISEPARGSNLYDLKEYLPNGVAKRIGQISAIAPLKFEGQCITYFPSGGRRYVQFYNNGIIKGDEYEYFPNGKLYIARKFSGKPTEFASITACNDSLGNPLVTDGNGHCVLYTPDFKYIESEGEIKGGLKTGEWKARPLFIDEPLQLIETYSRGKFISGKSIDKAGVVVSYQQRFLPPTYKNGVKGFYQFLSANANRNLVKRKINLQAIIATQFVVEKDGSLTDISVTKSFSEELDNESLRLITLSSNNWNPAIYYGRPTKARIIESINFVLLYRAMGGPY